MKKLQHFIWSYVLHNLHQALKMGYNMPIEIKKIEDFNKYNNSGVGYIWIEDKDRDENYIHPAKCYHVKEIDFVKKVCKNKNEYGRYFYHEDIEVLEKWAEANKRWKKPIKRCSLCR